MSQQPPDWFRQPRGPRIGCADVTIVSIASIIAFVILIFVVLRPDFARFIDITGSNDITVGAVRATETPGGAQTPGTPSTSGIGGVVATKTTATGTTSVTGTTARAATTSIKPTVTIIATPAVPTPTLAATPTVPPTPAFKVARLLDDCRLRQDPSYQAQIIQIFTKGSFFRIYDEKRTVKDTQSATDVNWQRVEPDDKTNRQGWMVTECF